MIRNLKVLGVAAVAVLAMSAAIASAAQGAVTAGANPATVKGVQTNTNTLSNGIRTVSCTEANLTGTLAGSAESVTIAPTYGGCTGNGGTTATVTTTGCKYILTPDSSAASGTGKVSVSCEAGKNIVVEIWATGKSHSEAKLCKLEVPTQGPLSGGSYKNAGSGSTEHIELSFEITSLKVLRTEGTAANCGAAEKTNASYTGNIDATATNEGGTQVALMVG